MVSVKEKKHKCVIENINVKKSRTTFLAVRILTAYTGIPVQIPAGYVTDINFLLTVWYNIIVQTKTIVQRIPEWNYSFTNKETYRGICNNISSMPRTRNK